MSGGLRRRYPAWTQDGKPSQRDMHGILDDIDHQLRDLHRRVGGGPTATATTVFRQIVTSRGGGGGGGVTPVPFGLVWKELVADQATYTLGFAPSTGLRLVWVRGILLQEGATYDYTIEGITLTLLRDWVPRSQAGEVAPDLGYLAFLGLRPLAGGWEA